VRADIGDESQWGKTGTTDENGDAWFCGATEEVTACVWVGYADSNTPMLTEYAGAPVDGGTFPALIWAGVISAWEAIAEERAAERRSEREKRDSGNGDGDSPAPPSEGETYVPPSSESETAPAPETEEAPEPTPEPEATPEEAPAPSSPESGGGGGITAG